MKAVRLRAEYLQEPVGIDIVRPRLSWNCEDGIRQTAYQIIAKVNGKTVWNSGNEYFKLYAEYDMKPTVAGLGMALGLDRRRLWEIKTGNHTSSTPKLPPEVEDSIKKAYKLMENLWESYMNSGKINPVSGIFLGKNNFGYQDKTEYVLTPNSKHDSDYDADDIRKRYLTAGATIDSDSDSDS